MPLPVFGAAGTGAATTSSSSISVPYPASIEAGDLLILQVLNWSSGGSGITTPSGWTQIGAGHQGSGGEHRAYYKAAVGTESGSLSVSTNSGGSIGSYGRMYRFDSAANIGTVIEAAAVGTGSTAVIADTGVITTGDNRVAVNLVALKDNLAIGAFTGATGGTWAEATAEFTSATGQDACLQIQIADMAAAATINGGSFTVDSAVAPGSQNWSAIGFAILPGNIPVGLATETDTAFPITPVLTVAGLTAAVGLATETDSALAITPVSTAPADTSLFAGIRFNTESGGGYEDLSTRVTAASVRRGRPFNTDPIEAGTASIRFNNGDGELDPANNLGANYGNILPLRPVWLYRVADGITYQRFQGVVERYQPEWAPPQHQFMKVDAADGFERLANEILVSDISSLETALAGANNDLVFTAREAGGSGDNISVTYTVAGVDTALGVSTNEPLEGSAKTEGRIEVPKSLGILSSMFGGNRQKAAVIVPVDVQGTDINVAVATNGAGAATSTATDIKASLEASADVMNLVSVAHAAGSSGAGVVTAMAKTNLSGGKWPVELAGARINRVLDLIGWPADQRDIDAGAFLMAEKGFDRSEHVSALAHIQDIAESDLGYVFISGAGNIIFHDGIHRSDDPRSTTAQAVFSDDGVGFPFYDLQISLDKDRIANEVTVTGGANGALPQTVTDVDSQAVYETRSLSLASQVASDEDALAVAETLLDVFKDPRVRFESIRLLDVGADNWASVVLGLEIGDLVTVRTTPPVADGVSPYTISYDCFIEEIADDIAPGLPHQVSLRLTLFAESLSQPPPPGGGAEGVILNSLGGTLIIDDPVNGLVAA